ncbi:MAG: hypothetical protein ABFC88_11125 [Thermoguttaceae bacterium]
MKISSMQQAFFLGWWTIFIATIAAAADSDPSRWSLRPERKVGQVDRVTVKLETNGETKFTEDGKPQKEKMSVLCELDYLEKTLAVDQVGGRAIRDYQKVSATVRIGDSSYQPALAASRRRVVVEAGDQSVVKFLPAGNLLRDELDTIDMQADSLLLDRLLPDRPVGVGDRWAISEPLAAALLGLDEVAKSTVECTLKEVTPTVARFEIGGRVEGAANGVSTVVKLRGRCRFDRRVQRVDWIGWLIQDSRPSSFVTDGMDVVSRLQVLVAPAKEPESLGEAALAAWSKKMTATPDRLLLSYQSPDGSWRLNYDRGWYLHHQRPQSSVAVLRRLDRGELAGQCNLASLAKGDPEKMISIEDFQQDVRRALDKNFGEFVEAGQSANAAKYRVYRVVAEGVASEIPMRWIYYLITDAEGHQAALTFAVEQSHVKRFADADKPMVDSLRFLK